MNITEKKLENSRIELIIDVPADMVENEYQSVFKSLQKKVSIDGFRKGKAPIQLVEQKYINTADREAAENLLKNVFVDAVTEKKLTPIAQPQYDFETITRGEAFTFKAVFEVPPTVELGKYRDIHAEEPVCKITGGDVQAEIDSFRERDAQVKDKEGKDEVENGDFVKIMVKRVDDIPDGDEESVDFKDYSIIVGKSKDDSALDKRILGMKAGEERQVDVKYPKDYSIKDLAGQKVAYRVKVAEIKTMELPELNDDLAKKFGFESRDDMENKTRENLEKYVTEKSRATAKAEIIKNIIENSSYDIPESVIISEMASIFRRTQERIGYMSNSIEELASLLGMNPDELREKLRTDAEQSIKTALSLSEIARVEQLSVDEERYREVIERIAKSNNQSVEEIEEVIRRNNSRENIERELILDQAMDFIYENAKIKKLKPVSFEEFVKMQN